MMAHTLIYCDCTICPCPNPTLASARLTTENKTPRHALGSSNLILVHRNANRTSIYHNHISKSPNSSIHQIYAVQGTPNRIQLSIGPVVPNSTAKDKGIAKSPSTRRKCRNRTVARGHCDAAPQGLSIFYYATGRK